MQVTQQSRGYGFVHMDNANSAGAASRALTGKVVDGKALVVRQRSEPPGSGPGAAAVKPFGIGDHDASKLFVGGLGPTTTEESLRQVPMPTFMCLVSLLLCVADVKRDQTLPLQCSIQNILCIIKHFAATAKPLDMVMLSTHHLCMSTGFPSASTRLHQRMSCIRQSSWWVTVLLFLLCWMPCSLCGQASHNGAVMLACTKSSVNIVA